MGLPPRVESANEVTEPRAVATGCRHSSCLNESGPRNPQSGEIFIASVGGHFDLRRTQFKERFRAWTFRTHGTFRVSRRWPDRGLSQVAHSIPSLSLGVLYQLTRDAKTHH